MMMMAMACTREANSMIVAASTAAPAVRSPSTHLLMMVIVIDWEPQVVFSLN